MMGEELGKGRQRNEGGVGFEGNLGGKDGRWSGSWLGIGDFWERWESREELELIVGMISYVEIGGGVVVLFTYDCGLSEAVSRSLWHRFRVMFHGKK
jgi:hypothetical protein